MPGAVWGRGNEPGRLSGRWETAGNSLQADGSSTRSVPCGGRVREGEGEASAKRRGKKIPRGEDNETGKVRGADNSP